MPQVTQADREGPAPIVAVSKPACDGCKHLKTKWWKDYLDNDETDSGTSARCAAVPDEYGGKSITAYWSKGSATPAWCPFLATAIEKGAHHG